MGRSAATAHRGRRSGGVRVERECGRLAPGLQGGRHQRRLTPPWLTVEAPEGGSQVVTGRQEVTGKDSAVDAGAGHRAGAVLLSDDASPGTNTQVRVDGGAILMVG